MILYWYYSAHVMFLSFLLSRLLHILSPIIWMMCVCRILIKITYLLTKRKAAEAADSKSRHYVSAQYPITFDKQLFFFSFGR